MRHYLFTFILALLSLLIFAPLAIAGTIGDAIQVHLCSADVEEGALKQGRDQFCELIIIWLPTTVAFMVNCFVIPCFIDLFAYSEAHYLRTNVFRSILSRNLILLMFTSLIIPSLALKSVSDVFGVISHQMTSFRNQIDNTVTASTCGDNLDQSQRSHAADVLAWSPVLGDPINFAAKNFGAPFLGAAQNINFLYVSSFFSSRLPACLGAVLHRLAFVIAAPGYGVYFSKNLTARPLFLLFLLSPSLQRTAGAMSSGTRSMPRCSGWLARSAASRPSCTGL